MKKILTLLLLAALVLSLGACGGEPAEPREAGYAFVYKDTAIEMGVDAAPILEALGEPVSCTEETSCAFEGLDRTYFYGSFYLQTSPEGEKENIYSLWLADDTVTTPEGLFIGAPQAQVEAIYGAEGFNGVNAYVIKKGPSRLTVILEDGLVSSIQYQWEIA